MELTMAAQWINGAFGPFDYAILRAMHEAAMACSWILTPLFELITLVGEQGAIFFVLGIVLALFRRTRVWGICIIVAICIGALCTSFVLKDLIARPRPLADEAGVYYAWWLSISAPVESGPSFPSGHVTAAAAAMTALVCAGGARFGWVAAAVVAAMGASRMYLMAHYPSDIVAAIIVGVCAGILSWVIMEQLLGFARRNPRSALGMLSRKMGVVGHGARHASKKAA